MYAETIDTGEGIAFLRGFGPPEVVELPNFLGNASVTEEASGFWECVEAVSFLYTPTGGAANRLPRLRWFAGDAAPFAQAVIPAAITAGLTTRVTFAVRATTGGSPATGAVVTQMPGLLILPGWQVTIDAPAGLVGDTVTGVRLYRQRYQLIEFGER